MPCSRQGAASGASWRRTLPQSWRLWKAESSAACASFGLSATLCHRRCAGRLLRSASLHNYTHNLRKVCEATSSVPVFHSRLQKGVQLTAIRDRVNWSMLQRAHGVQPGAMCPRLHLRHREGRERGLRGRCGGAGRLWRQDGGGCHGKGRKRPGRRGRGRRGGPPLHTRIET